MKFMSLFLASAILFGQFSVALAQSSVHSPKPDHPSVHGMLLFGEHKIYLSHLPLFHSPHDYQVLLEVELSPEAKSAYLSNRAQHPEQTVFTIAPESFVLPEMIEAPQPFEASLFLGHFERGGVVIASGVTVSISKILYFNKFKPKAKHPDQLTYLFFGNETEVFAAHLIEAKPDFDHIVSIKNTGTLSSLLKQEGVIEVQFPGHEPQDPLTVGNAGEGETLSESGSSLKVPYEVERGLYLEHGDLSF